jgi:hypothetical protein
MIRLYQYLKIMIRERNSSEEKLDRLLAANGLVRKKVAADGNCFFKAALLHVPNVRNENDLRQTCTVCPFFITFQFFHFGMKVYPDNIFFK